MLGRSAVRNSENPLGPAVYVRALLRAAEDTRTAQGGLGILPDRVLREPLGEELGAHCAGNCSSTIANHGVDVRAIRRTPRRTEDRDAAGWQPARHRSVAWRHEFAGELGRSRFGRDAARPGRRGLCGRRQVRHAHRPRRTNRHMLLGGLLTRLQVKRTRVAAAARCRRTDRRRSSCCSRSASFSVMASARASAETGDFAMLPTSQSISAMRDELISKSTRVVDKLTIELVGMLFDHVMQDKQVPAEIKARISRLAVSGAEGRTDGRGVFRVERTSRAQADRPHRRHIGRLGALRRRQPDAT